MSNVQVVEVTAGSNWDLAKLQKNSKVFNNYIRSNIAKFAGTTKSLRRNLLKPITVADGETVNIKISANKKAGEDLTITYTVTVPDGTVAIKIDNVSYTTKADLITDLDEVDTDIANIK